MIQKLITDIEKTIRSSPIVLSSSIHHYFDAAAESVYLKGRLTFIDSSVLDLAIFAFESYDAPTIDKYRFQYMSGLEKIVFRYDNAPHHPEIESFPHHKHLSGKVSPSLMPSIADILNEISAIILKEKS